MTVQAGERQWIREMNPSTSYLSSHDPRLHFGLGHTPTYDSIEVEWADGTRQLTQAGETDRELIIGRGRKAIFVPGVQADSDEP